jgi:hypothetical protein
MAVQTWSGRDMRILVGQPAKTAETDSGERVPQQITEHPFITNRYGRCGAISDLGEASHERGSAGTSRWHIVGATGVGLEALQPR